METLRAQSPAKVAERFEVYDPMAGTVISYQEIATGAGFYWVVGNCLLVLCPFTLRDLRVLRGKK